MQHNRASDRRNVIPRWQSLADSPPYELRSSEQVSQPELQYSTKAALDQWSRDRKLDTAFGVLENAFVTSDREEVKRAAEYVIDPKNDANTLYVDLAKTILREVDKRSEITSPSDNHRRAIASLRKRLLLSPDDALSAIEIARIQTSLGQLKAAKKHVERALRTAPENRYILRSAARYYWHIDEKEQALGTLRSARSLRVDPWLQSCEVAFCDLLDRTPHWGRKRLRELKNRTAGQISTSELAAGLGAWELNHGSSKAAKKLFSNSMLAPTENALAQATWTKSHSLLPTLDVPVTRLNDPEANLYESYQRRDVQGVLNSATRWLDREPYSSRAASNGSSAALSLTSNPARAIEYCDRGLHANPNDFTLLNNKCVAAVRLLDFELAASLVRKIKGISTDEDKEIFLFAIDGLTAFRSGAILDGRFNYMRACEIAAEKKDFRLTARAVMFWMEEEAVAGTMELSEMMPVIELIDDRASTLNRAEFGFEFTWQQTRDRIKAQLTEHDRQASFNYAPLERADTQRVGNIVRSAEDRSTEEFV